MSVHSHDRTSREHTLAASQLWLLEVDKRHGLVPRSQHTGQHNREHSTKPRRNPGTSATVPGRVKHRELALQHMGRRHCVKVWFQMWFVVAALLLRGGGTPRCFSVPFLQVVAASMLVRKAAQRGRRPVSWANSSCLFLSLTRGAKMILRSLGTLVLWGSRTRIVALPGSFFGCVDGDDKHRD